ncbi:MAG TPA: TylF/MycF/NovP-related O-methyltransferase [Labilithrix sp.]|nr:TylF/MycF/NovP-related O-methyltransferase [Labilithrix sp.]
MRIPNLRPLTDSKLFWQRMVLYSKRLSPRLRWQAAAGFDDVWPAARERTVVEEGAAHMLFQLARHASKLDGMFAEVGVYRGGTAKLLAGIADRAGRELHLFDTFAGMPETDRTRDLHTAGDFSDTSLAAVQSFLAAHRSPKFHQGEFPGTATSLADARFSLVHVDADIASSVAACCEFFYPRLVPGGVMVFDDYGQTSCPGAKSATDAFFADKPEPVLHLLTSQAMVLKLP